AAGARGAGDPPGGGRADLGVDGRHPFELPGGDGCGRLEPRGLDGGMGQEVGQIGGGGRGGGGGGGGGRRREGGAWARRSARSAGWPRVRRTWASGPDQSGAVGRAPRWPGGRAGPYRYRPV